MSDRLAFGQEKCEVGLAEGPPKRNEGFGWPRAWLMRDRYKREVIEARQALVSGRSCSRPDTFSDKWNDVELITPTTCCAWAAHSKVDGSWHLVLSRHVAQSWSCSLWRNRFCEHKLVMSLGPALSINLVQFGFGL